MKKERGDEIQFTTKIGGKTNLGPNYFILKDFISSYAFNALSRQNWPFTPSNCIHLIKFYTQLHV